MFELIILNGIRGSGKTTAELYQLAEKEVPQLCTAEPCLHHRRVRDPQPEWRHRLRNEQQMLQKEGRIRLEGRRWQVVPSNPVKKGGPLG